jgi:hypothetical protein
MSDKRNDSPKARAARAVVAMAIVSVLLAVFPPASAGAAADPLQTVSGSFLDTQMDTLTSTLVVDGAGGEHMAVDRQQAGSPSLRTSYAYCPPGPACVTPGQWAQVDVPLNVSRFTAPSQLKLTNARR